MLCTGGHLAIFGAPAFVDKIVAFDMGPIVTTVWRQRYEPPVTGWNTDDALLLTIGYVDAERRRLGARTSEISVDVMRKFHCCGQCRSRGAVALFDQTRQRRSFRPLPPPNPVDPRTNCFAALNKVFEPWTLDDPSGPLDDCIERDQPEDDLRDFVTVWLATSMIDS